MVNRIPPATGSYYHVYNRGVDKRTVFNNKQDLNRFLKSLIEFNTVKPVGSLFRLSKLSIKQKSKKPLVELVAYCLNPNHYHLILRQLEDGGISEFMRRVNGGYTCYFNEIYGRSGALFQGRFKSKHIQNDAYLKHLSAYVNLNYKVHKLRGSTPYQSSWNEYIGKIKSEICEKNIVLEQFKNINEYKRFVKESLHNILKKKDDLKDIEFEKISSLAQIRKNYARSAKNKM